MIELVATRPAFSELLEESVEGTEFLSDLQKFACIRYCCRDFQTISDDPRVRE